MSEFDFPYHRPSVISLVSADSSLMPESIGFVLLQVNCQKCAMIVLEFILIIFDFISGVSLVQLDVVSHPSEPLRHPQLPHRRSGRASLATQSSGEQFVRRAGAAILGASQPPTLYSLAVVMANRCFNIVSFFSRFIYMFTKYTFN